MPDPIVAEIDREAGLVFGAVWRFCQGDFGECFATVDTIAARVGMGTTAARVRLRKLTTAGWITETRRKGETTIYRDAGRWRMRVVGVSEPQRQTLPPPTPDVAPPQRQTLPKKDFKIQTKNVGASTDDAADAADPTPPETLVKAGSANQNGTADQAEPNGTGKPKSRRSSAPRIPLGPGSLVYRDVIRYTPNHAQRELLDAAHAAHGEAAMRAVMVAWMAHGYSPKNVAGMVDAINAGGLRTNGHNGAGSRANGKPLSAMVLEI